MQQDFPFQPRGATGTTPTAQTNIAVTTGVQQLTLPAVQSEGGTIRIVNEGPANISWSFGVSASLTTGNGVLMLANTVETFGLPGGITQLSVIGTIAGSNMRVICGDGI